MSHQRLLVAVFAGLVGCMAELEPTPVEEPPDTEQPDSPRVLEGLQVLYTFDEGEGRVVNDRSGVEPAFDLELDNLVTNKWVPGGGIEIVGNSVITSLDVADKVFAACVQANAVTLEAWVEPANVTQTGTVFTYGKQNNTNAALTVNNTVYAGSVRTATPDPNMAGEVIEAIQTVQSPTNTAAVAAQHLVFTRDVTAGASLYVNGIDVRPMPPMPTEPPPVADQTTWAPGYQLVIGNRSNGQSPWLGKVYLLAIYCKKLSADEVQKNYVAGP